MDRIDSFFHMSGFGFGERRSRHFLLMLFFFALCAGCATTKAPDASREEAIKGRRLATVLLRISAKADGESMDALKHLTIGGANLDAYDCCKPIASLTSPSRNAAKKGWLSLKLAPGDVYKLCFGLGLDKSPCPSFPSSSTFWLRVPEDARLVYAGSLQISCEGTWNDRRTRYLPTSCTLSVEDESETASAAAREWFPALQPMSTALLRPWNYSSLARLSPEDLPLGLATAAAKSLKSPSWYRRSFGRATGIGDWLTNPKSSGTRQGPVFDNPFVQGLAEGGAQLVAQYAAAVYVMYFPFGCLWGIAEGAHSTAKWQPCLDKLSERFELDTAWGAALSEALSTRGIVQITEIPTGDNMFKEADQLGAKSILEARVARMELKECRPRWTFSLDVAFQARLWGTVTGSLLNPSIEAFSQTECHKIEDYCGATGAEMIKNELLKIFKRAAVDIAGRVLPPVDQAELVENIAGAAQDSEHANK